MWLIASELAGVIGLPGSDRNIREQLKKLATENPELARKRQGTKGTEYHISLLPMATQTALYKREGQIKVGDQVLAPPKKKSQQFYCSEALWAGWNKTNHAAQSKAQFALRTTRTIHSVQIC